MRCPLRVGATEYFGYRSCFRRSSGAAAEYAPSGGGETRFDRKPILVGSWRSSRRAAESTGSLRSPSYTVSPTRMTSPAMSRDTTVFNSRATRGFQHGLDSLGHEVDGGGVQGFGRSYLDLDAPSYSFSNRLAAHWNAGKKLNRPRRATTLRKCITRSIRGRLTAERSVENLFLGARREAR